MSSGQDDEYKQHSFKELPLGQLQELYLRVLTELLGIKEEFEEFQLTSKEYETELENENEVNSKKAQEYEDLSEKLAKDLDKIRDKYNKEVKAVEKENESLKKALDETGDKSKINHQKLVTLEIENEDYERQLRISEQIISDLEQKLDTSLEEIALLQSELDELKQHSQEQVERLKQQLDEINIELQVKDRELKKLKFQQLLSETQAPPPPYPNQYVQNQGSSEKRHSFGGRIQEMTRRNTTHNANADKYMNSLINEQQEDVFEKSEMVSKRPESARTKLPMRDSLFSKSQSAQLDSDHNKLEKYSQNEIHHTPVKEAQEQEEDGQDNDESSQQDKTLENKDAKLTESEHEDQEDDNEQSPQSQRKTQNSASKDHSQIQNEEQTAHEEQDFKHVQIQTTPADLAQEKLQQPTSFFHQYQIGGGIQIMQSHNEFEENMLMEDYDFEDLLECDDIEQTSFINSSKQLMSVLDNVINCIDDRISLKKLKYAPNQGYYGGAGLGVYGQYSSDEYGPGQNQFNNSNFYGQYYHKPTQSNNQPQYANPANAAKGAVDNFEKSRKVSVLY